jgi:large subunit ribosomal protein LP2
MKYLAAYLLAQLGGHEHPTAKDISKILAAVGVDADAAQAEKVVASLSGKDVNAVRIFPRFGILTL